MRVLSVSYPFAPVTETVAGGAEHVLRMVDGALTARGWDSVVIAAEGSHVRGRLCPVPVPAFAIDDDHRHAIWGRWRTAIEHTIDGWGIELVHFHGVDFPAYLPDRNIAMLATLHLPRERHTTDVLRLGRERLRFNAVSKNQLATLPRHAAVLGWIENGVELDAYESAREKQPFVLALGRICPEKGFHLALEAARRAQVRMILAGQVFGYPAHQAYFAKEIVPRLDAHRMFIGPVAELRKRRLLAAARCLLVPSLIAETSSLVAMEAMASGTPVVAFRAGALPEIVEEGRTGFIVESTDAMVDAIARVRRLDGRVCRQVAEARFSARRMAGDYAALYGQVLDVARSRAPNGNRATVEVVTEVSRLARSRNDWEKLWERCPRATPFQHPGWLLPWWRYFGGGKSLFAVIVRRGDRITAMAPCCIQTCNPARDRELVLAGTGNTDYLDALCTDGGDAELIVQTICESAHLWDRVDLQELSAASLLLRPAVGPGFTDSRAPDHACPVIALSPSARSADQLITRSFARTLRHARRRLGDRDAVCFEHATSEDQARGILGSIFELHTRRWSARGEEGALAGKPVRAFHRDVIAELFRTGIVRLYRLLVTGHPVAAFYGFAHAGTAYAYLAGFDPAHRALSPGHLIVAYAIDSAIAEDASRFDFLRGREPYKYRWGARDEHNVRRRIWKR